MSHEARRGPGRRNGGRPAALPPNASHKVGNAKRHRCSDTSAGAEFNGDMRRVREFVFFLLVAAMCAVPTVQSRAQSSSAGGSDMRAAAEQVIALANQARAQAGVGQLQWDPALAAAALKHCQRMAQEGPIAHRYGGEPDLGDRAAQAGAHFSVIEENVAIGQSPEAIHEEWMQSPGHRQNLLAPEIDRIGVAIVPARGVLYAVADYSRGVQQMDASQVEARVAALIKPSGVEILRDPSVARAACATDEGMPRAEGAMQPRFIMRWQDAELSHLPPELAQRLSTSRYRSADVGACPAQGVEGSFSAFRIAVILY
jgi:uncharacterized protein YkwD